MGHRSILFLVTLLLSPSVFSDGEPMHQDPNEGYVAPGKFYWTRLYWKGTKDAFDRGALYFVDENGKESRTNLFLIAGMNRMIASAKRYNEEALESLKTYGTPSEVLPQRDDWDNFKTGAVKVATKPWGLIAHKAEKVKENAKRNYEDMGGATLRNWGPLGRIVVTAWNGLQIVGETIGIIGVELPLELAFRIVPKYWIGVTLDPEDGIVTRDGFVSSTVRPILRPFLPVLGAGWYWGVLEPSNLALRGTPSATAGAVGTLLTGMTALAEGGKYLVWDSWRSESTSTDQETAFYQTEDGKNVGFIIPVPEDPKVSDDLRILFENAEDSHALALGFEEIISQNPDKKWVALSYITSRLAETIHALHENGEQYQGEDREARLTEAAYLSNLKAVYSEALKEEMEGS
ncbi:MAG: hypothetical protein AAB309_05235 [Deltaproteobacteria bacterium]